MAHQIDFLINQARSLLEFDDELLIAFEPIDDDATEKFIKEHNHRFIMRMDGKRYYLNQVAVQPNLTTIELTYRNVGFLDDNIFYNLNVNENFTKEYLYYQYQIGTKFYNANMIYLNTDIN